MFNLIKKKNKQKSSGTTLHGLPSPKYDFVKQYTLVNPRKMLLDYNLFSWCENIPVKYESENSSGWSHCVSLPTQVFLGYLNALERAPDRIANDPKSRTISVVSLKNDRFLFILPNLKSPKKPIYAYEQGTLAFDVTPEINRAIVEQVKMFTR